MRPSGLSHHLMEGKGELRHVRHALSPERSDGVDRASRSEGRESIAIEIRATFGPLCQKLFGWFGGGGINGTGVYGEGSNDFGLF